MSSSARRLVRLEGKDSYLGVVEGHDLLGDERLERLDERRACPVSSEGGARGGDGPTSYPYGRAGSVCACRADIDPTDRADERRRVEVDRAKVDMAKESRGCGCWAADGKEPVWANVSLHADRPGIPELRPSNTRRPKINTYHISRPEAPDESSPRPH